MLDNSLLKPERFIEEKVSKKARAKINSLGGQTYAKTFSPAIGQLFKHHILLLDQYFGTVPP